VIEPRSASRRVDCPISIRSVYVCRRAQKVLQQPTTGTVSMPPSHVLLLVSRAITYRGRESSRLLVAHMLSTSSSYTRLDGPAQVAAGHDDATDAVRILHSAIDSTSSGVSSLHIAIGPVPIESAILAPALSDNRLSHSKQALHYSLGITPDRVSVHR
jgi:hypothetical protein